MRCQLSIPVLVAALTLPAAAPAQAIDSAAVRRILVAEDRRDTSAAAFASGLASADPRIRAIAQRARARVSDPRYVSRDSLPPLVAPPAYPDPAWRLRFRALATRPVECGKLTQALSDSVWAVRLRAADLATAECASDTALVATLRDWTSRVPATGARARNGVSWHPAAHGLVALARVSPGLARPLVPRFASSRVASVRAYAARAAGTLSDTGTLRRLAVDPNDNVKEAAIEALSKVAGHSADDVYMAALSASGYQAIRAAANALKGAERSEAITRAARDAYSRLMKEPSETSKDARSALYDVLTGQRVIPLGDAARRPLPAVEVGRDAVALALGREYRIRVTLADSSGGGSFVVRLRGDAAPIMGARVLELVRSGWYNGRTWYRVEPDFVIQGGGPGSNEYVGHPRFMRDELSAIPQVRGTVGMSTRGHDTGDAQWFVNLRDNQRLTRDYTTWGEVIEGIDVVDGILEGDVIATMEIVKG